MMSQREKQIDSKNADISPRVLEMNKNYDFVSNIPLVLTKSMSEGFDPFESVKRNLTNGTLRRDKIFPKFKKSNDVSIGGKLGSSFTPYIKSSNQSKRTSSSSLDSNLDKKTSREISPLTDVPEECPVQSWTSNIELQKEETSSQLPLDMLKVCSTILGSLPSEAKSNDPGHLNQSSNLETTNFDPFHRMYQFVESDPESKLMDLLDDYPTDVLQKTALLLIQKSLSRPKSFQVSQKATETVEVEKTKPISEKDSSKIDEMSDDSSDFKPCNCRKSKCLKLYCECFSNGRKCTSKCDCFSC